MIHFKSLPLLGAFLFAIAALSSCSPIVVNLKQMNTSPDVGELRDWVVNSTVMPDLREQFSALESAGKLYVLGGDNGGNGTGQIFYAGIQGDGSLGAWTTNAYSIPTPRHRHTSILYNGFMYVMGGNAAGSAQSSVFFGPVNGDGSVGPWATTTSMPGGRRRHTSVVYNGVVYILGGSNPGHNTVFRAPFQTNGTITSWTTDASPIPAKVYHHSTVLKGNRIYVIGGRAYDGTTTSLSDQIYYTTINPDGSLGAWNTSAIPLPKAMAEHQSFIQGKHVYVAGGSDSNGASDAVYSATINSDGSIGDWYLLSATLPGARTLQTSIVGTNSKVYLFGGRDATPTVSNQIFISELRN